jgi:hypothetical protein
MPPPLGIKSRNGARAKRKNRCNNSGISGGSAASDAQFVHKACRSREWRRFDAIAGLSSIRFGVMPNGDPAALQQRITLDINHSK